MRLLVVGMSAILLGVGGCSNNERIGVQGAKDVDAKQNLDQGNNKIEQANGTPRHPLEQKLVGKWGDVLEKPSFEFRQDKTYTKYYDEHFQMNGHYKATGPSTIQLEFSKAEVLRSNKERGLTVRPSEVPDVLVETYLMEFDEENSNSLRITNVGKNGERGIMVVGIHRIGTLKQPEKKSDK